MHRRLFLVAAGAAVAGCASTEFKPLAFAPNVVLQDPLPGKAIVYVLRTPHDRPALDVYLGDRKVASLGPSTYTVLSVDPGSHELNAALAGSPPEVPPSTLTVKAGERRFVYTSVPTRSSTALHLVGAGALGVIPLMTPSVVPVGARRWTECREEDAQGLMSTSSLVLPERGED
jgi:hypothetical protein